MNGAIVVLFGIIILCPFIVTISFLILMRIRGQAPASVIGLAADVTTPLLFISVSIVAYTIFGEGTVVYIAGIAIMIAIIYTIVERIKVKEFRIVRMLRKTWRIYFLILSVSYLLLLLGGVLLKIIEYVN
ncbi:DUF3397 family protein [Sporosarcina limicola]|uniref:DUF3397 domain-containing protein n=1 Tax=Sporosarcina limicola TaxID=34101 RepID=A0A927MFC8_9BACL|nr:DUF3397 family protein [Sporosarcina limicola]MBE1553565.1 hypothetical protein [Sporosarcina limicola]